MRLLGWLALAAMVGGTVSADARMHAPYRGHRIAPSTAAPLDAFPSPAAAYSLRKLKSTYAGPGVKLQRASDNAQADIGFLGFTGFTGAPLDVAAANAHCAATTCAVVTWYDQSGNARHLTAPGATLPYVANCVNNQPCVRMVDGNSYLRSAAVTWAAAKNAMSAVAKRSGTVATCYLGLRGSGNFAAWTAATQWVFLDSGAINLPAASENTWHAAIANFDGASSVGRLDGAEATGTVTGSAGSTAAGIGPTTAGTTCDQTEFVMWDNYALAPAERMTLTNNQRSFWGF